MEAVDYTDTFVTVSPDTLATPGLVTDARPSGPTVAFEGHHGNAQPPLMPGRQGAAPRALLSVILDGRQERRR